MNQLNTSLWGDEAFAAVLAQKSLWEIVTILTHDTSPPLYYFIEHYFMALFGTSEIAIRVLSFALFLITAFFVYKIGEFLWDKKTGVIAALLTFLNPFLFIYGFEGRMYAILGATVTASMYFFLKRSFLLYVVATTAALYSHHFAIFAVLVQGLWWVRELFFGERKTARLMFKSFVVIGLLYLPWLYPLYLQISLVGSGFWLGRPDLEEVWKLARKFLAEAISHQFATPVLYLLGIALIIRRWEKDVSPSIFLLLWFIIPILVTFIVSQFFQSIFFDRYLLYTIPAAMLILASNRRRAGEQLLLIAGILLFVINAFYFTHPTKQPFRELANYVKQTKRTGDVLINHNARAHHLWEAKYYDIPAPIMVPQGDLPFYTGTALMEKGDIIRSVQSGAARIGVITSGNLAEVTLTGYTQKEKVTFNSLTFAWYEKNSF